MRGTCDQCRHCGTIGGWTVECSAVADDKDAEERDFEPCGTAYEVWRCARCKQLTLVSGLWVQSMEAGDWSPSVVFPAASKPLRGLPPLVARAYEAAELVKRVSPNAYAVLLGRVLDAVCIEHGVTGGDLHDLLNKLADEDKTPKHVADLAQQLRKLRNIGAHGTAGTLGPAELPVLEATCRAVLEYVYEAPRLVAEVQERVRTLKAAGKAALAGD